MSRRSSASTGIAASVARVRYRAREPMGCSAMRGRYYSRLVLLRALAIAMLFATSANAPARAQTTSQFASALPGYEYAFPRDHGTHDEYKTEWWYYTGHFTATDGRRFGFELTFFRAGIVPPSAGTEAA